MESTSVRLSRGRAGVFHIHEREAMSKDPRVATTYLQIEPHPIYRGEAKVVRATQNKPDQPLGGCVVVKLKIRMPGESWDAFEPEAIIDIPASLVHQPVQVMVGEVEPDPEPEPDYVVDNEPDPAH